MIPTVIWPKVKWLLLCVLTVSWGALAEGVVSEGETADSRVIAVESDSRTDSAIRKRIQNIFNNLENFSTIQVSVSAGVVHLAGEVLMPSVAKQAVKVAGQIEGVVSVDSDIEVNQNLPDRLQLAADKAEGQLFSILDYIPLIAVALSILVFFWLVANLIGRWLTRLFVRNGDSFISDLFRQMLKLVIVLIGVLLALQVLDATALLGSILGAAGLVGLAIGFALKDTVENFIASVLLSLRNPFSPGDLVKIDEHEGMVIRLTSRATLLMSFDGNHIRIPNSGVFMGVITNFSRNPQRRFQFNVGVGTAVDLREARALAVECLKITEGVLASPAPNCQIDSLGDSTVVLELYGWVNQTESDFVKVRSAAIQNLKCAFDEADIDMPEPIYRLNVKQETTQKTTHETTREARTTRQKKSPDTILRELRNQKSDVSRDTDLEEQVMRESDLEDDLLDTAAPKE